ncbi:MAG: radical SAM family heme chaperone HemW [Clostridium sp.]|nr:radical SAM family heme chaperone HemW [Clostridium sp.]
MEKSALYVHIPFCKQKCLYCDFPSFCNVDFLMEDYIDALVIELKKIEGNKISTIFIGGGTPTYLSLQALKKLKKVFLELDIDKKIEFTVEGNPGTFSKKKLEILKSMGVNRLSIGLQAVQDKLLKELGRIHNFNEFLESYNIARKVGFENINIDLMFGLPNQSFDDWKKTLNEVLKLNPQHLSCYSLIIEEGTPFYKLYNEDNLPEEDLVLKMYEYTKEILKQNGYNHYEISNFAKEGYECRHNLVYWELLNYIGVGSSSHSYYNGKRYKNEANVKKYIEKINENGSAVIEEHQNSLEDDMEEFVFLGLRKMDGISIYEFKKRFGKDIYSVYGKVIEKYQKDKMIFLKNGRLSLSSRGINISNYILSDFIIEV